MNLPAGQLLRDRVVERPREALVDALDRELTGYAALEPQDALLLDGDDLALLTFREGVPLGAYHAGSGRGGPPALADLAVSGPYSLELRALSPDQLSSVHEESHRVPPGMPADRLAGDPDLAGRTRDRAADRGWIDPADRPGERATQTPRSAAESDRDGRRGGDRRREADRRRDDGRRDDRRRPTHGTDRSRRPVERDDRPPEEPSPTDGSGRRRVDSADPPADPPADPSRSDPTGRDPGRGRSDAPPGRSDHSGSAPTPEETTRSDRPARQGGREDADAVAAFLADEQKIEAIREQAREQARERAAEWGLDDQLE